jgi:CRISPR/Cas system-associated exonuclease Cas4 (RecB family)
MARICIVQSPEAYLLPLLKTLLGRIVLVWMIDFNEMVTNYIKRESRAKSPGRYYPSEIGGCMRKTWYSYKHPKKLQPELLKIFEMGNMVHDFVVKVLESEKNREVQLLQSEFPLKIEQPDFLISGRVDDLVLVKTSGKTFVVEVKSTKSIDYVKEAAESHVMQLQLYMHATGIHNGIVLYIDKGNLQSKQFPIEYSETEVNGILKRFGELHQLLGSNLLPIDEAKKEAGKQWLCRFCEYSEKCEKNEA